MWLRVSSSRSSVLKYWSTCTKRLYSYDHFRSMLEYVGLTLVHIYHRVRFSSNVDGNPNVMHTLNIKTILVKLAKTSIVKQLVQLHFMFVIVCFKGSHCTVTHIYTKAISPMDLPGPFKLQQFIIWTNTCLQQSISTFKKLFQTETYTASSPLLSLFLPQISPNGVE